MPLRSSRHKLVHIILPGALGPSSCLHLAWRKPLNICAHTEPLQAIHPRTPAYHQTSDFLHVSGQQIHPSDEGKHGIRFDVTGPHSQSRNNDTLLKTNKQKALAETNKQTKKRWSGNLGHILPACSMSVNHRINNVLSSA